MSEKRARYDPGPPTPLSPEARRRLAIPEPDPAPEPDPLPDPAFSGCHKVRLKREDLEKWEGRRIEYWDGDTETAYVLGEPVTGTHELPARGLSAACALIAEARGSPIRSYGSMDLVQPGTGGERRRIMQADETVYLLPRRGLLPRGDGMWLGMHEYPDVVLEVDHTTDVRRWKLGFYESWGFPELWVDVPDRDGAWRRWPALTIYLLDGGKYREADESRAFPGWTAREIHVALNERSLSAATGVVLDRVGRALGARDGTAPDDSPWLRRHRDEGRDEILELAAREILALRGMSGAALDPREWAGLRHEDVMRALRECADLADLRARLQRSRGR